MQQLHLPRPSSVHPVMHAEPDLYQMPTLILLTALVAVFGALWLQGRRSLQPLGRDGEEAPTVQRRKLLWLTGWVFVVLRMAMQVSGRTEAGANLALMQASMELAPLMFLASLAPQYLTRKPPVLFVVAFGAPLLLYTLLVSLFPVAGVLGQGVLVLCAVSAITIAALWGLRRSLVPVWLSLLLVGLIGAGCIWLTARQEYLRVLTLAQSGVLLMSACLFASAFRRLTAGVVFTVGGLITWAVPAALATAAGHATTSNALAESFNLVKVITAVGMVVLVLEDEIASNLAAQHRDRRARVEMEKYTQIHLAPLPFDENDAEYHRICEIISAVSRFRQAAIFLRDPDGAFRLAGRTGIDGALEGALDALARRTTDQRIEEIAKEGRHFSQQIGNLTVMDLSPLMEPGDELQHMKFRKAHLIGIRSRERQLHGALLLAGLKNPEEPLQTEDVLPLELLVSRIGAARDHQALLRRLMQSERLAGLGQLAGGVAHELNNPLTVITGYAELLGDGDSVAGPEAAAVILNEARRMKQIIESLMRFRKASPAGRAPVSIRLLLEDIEHLVRPDLERVRVELQLRVPENTPLVRADGDQIRQVFLQVTRNAIGSLEELPEGVERRLTVDVASTAGSVQIMFSDTGPGFSDTARAFDPFYTTRHQGDGVGLGLSVCYSIVREHGGDISAVNLHPHGAGVVIELPADDSDAASEAVRRHSLAREGLSFGEQAPI